MENSRRVAKRLMRPKTVGLGRATLTPHCKVWLEWDDQIALSDWRVELLELVDATGSLAAAAKCLKVPYRTAWYKLKGLEECWGIHLLVTESGGAQGGGSHLTPEARQMVGHFRRIEAGIRQLVEERFRKEFKNVRFASH